MLMTLQFAFRTTAGYIERGHSLRLWRLACASIALATVVEPTLCSLRNKSGCAPQLDAGGMLTLAGHAVVFQLLGQELAARTSSALNITHAASALATLGKEIQWMSGIKKTEMAPLPMVS